MDKHLTHLQVGAITKPHGIRGEVKARLHFEGSDALFEAKHVVVELPKKPAIRMELEAVRGNSKNLILAFREVTTKEGADDLRGGLLWVERSSLPALEPGEYYLVDLVGCRIMHGGSQIAEVIAVRPDPTVDTMVLRLTDGTEADLPIVDAWVGRVDISAREVELLSTDGLIS